MIRWNSKHGSKGWKMASKHEARIKKLEARFRKVEHKTIVFNVLPARGKEVVGYDRITRIDNKDFTIIHKIPICK